MTVQGREHAAGSRARPDGMAVRRAAASCARVIVTALSRYYAEPLVRARIREYCGIGVQGAAASTAVYLHGMRPAGRGPEAQWELTAPLATRRLGELFESGADITRSLWDRRSLLFHLDIDYFNTDYPGEPFTHPAETFSRLEPVYRAVRLQARHFSLAPLWLMTGRGYHLTGRVPLSHPLVDALADRAPAPPAWRATADARLPSWLPERVSARHARAHTGLGLLIEYLAHRCLRRAERRSRVPVVFNGTVVGSGLSGRAAISLDFCSWEIRWTSATFASRSAGTRRIASGPTSWARAWRARSVRWWRFPEVRVRASCHPFGRGSRATPPGSPGARRRRFPTSPRASRVS